MNKIEPFWLYLEPYTFLSKGHPSTLLYNAKSCKGTLLTNSSKSVDGLIDYFLNPENLYSVLLTEKDLTDDHVLHFVNTLQEHGLGDIIEGAYPKPIIFPPMLNLQSETERLLKQENFTGEKYLDYIHELTLYVNGSCSYDCGGCQLFRQMPFCTKLQNCLDLGKIEGMLNQLSHSSVKVNITGGNIFEYPDFGKLVNLLDTTRVVKTALVHYQNLPKNLNDLQIFSSSQFKLKILVNTSISLEGMIAVGAELKKAKIDQQWLLLVASSQEYERACLLQDSFLSQSIEVIIKPYYNKKNLSFFEDNVFLREEDLLENNLDRREIFALEALNTNDFGKLTIMSDGSIYSNVNSPPIGSIEDPLISLVYKEMVQGHSWKQTRYKIEPCSHCAYRLICPSPSSYETIIGRPNLCEIAT